MSAPREPRRVQRSATGAKGDPRGSTRRGTGTRSPIAKRCAATPPGRVTPARRSSGRARGTPPRRFVCEPIGSLGPSARGARLGRNGDPSRGDPDSERCRPRRSLAARSTRASQRIANIVALSLRNPKTLDVEPGARRKTRMPWNPAGGAERAGGTEHAGERMSRRIIERNRAEHFLSGSGDL